MIIIHDFSWAISKALQGQELTYQGITDNHGLFIKYDRIRMYFSKSKFQNKNLLHLSAKAEGMYENDVSITEQDVKATNWEIINNEGDNNEIK